MIGLHAEILALLDPKRATPRNELLRAYPRSVHPDAIHKAIYELIRAGQLNETTRGLAIPVPPKDDETQTHEHGKASGRKGGKRSVLTVKRLPHSFPRLNAIGHAWCNVCQEYLPPSEFKPDLSCRNGIYSRCRCCDTAIRRERRAARRGGNALAA